MYEKIMVAVDGSASSKQALAEAVKVALAGDAHVSVVYVVDKSVLFTYAGRFDPHALVEIRDDGRKVLREAEQIIALAGAKGEAELVETESIGEDIAERLQRYVKEGGSISRWSARTGGADPARAARQRRGALRARLEVPVLLIRGDDDDVAATAAAA